MRIRVVAALGGLALALVFVITAANRSQGGLGLILFTADNQLSVLDVEGGGVRDLIASDALAARWSQSGEFLFIIEADLLAPDRLTVLSTNGDLVKHVVVGADWLGRADWYGEFLFYEVGRPGGMQELWKFNVVTDFRLRLTDNFVDDGSLDISSRGQLVFYRSQQEETHIYKMNAFLDSPATQLTTAGIWNSNPRWSPDGSMIAFRSDRTGSTQLFVMQADGAGVVQLTFQTRAGFGPSVPTWSPTGSQLAFASAVDGDWEIYVVGPDGQGLANLTDNGSFDTTPLWSPDGTQIAFQSDRDGDSGNIFIMNADGSGVESTGRNGTLLDWR